MKSLRELLSVLSVVLLTVSNLHSQDEFTPIAGWDKQLFPSFVIATAAIKTDESEANEFLLGDQNGLLGVSIESPGDGVPVEVTIECPPFATSSRYVGRLSSQGAVYSIFPKMNYDFTALSKCRQATPVNGLFRVRVGDGPICEKSVTMIVRPVNDCPLKVQVGEQVHDQSFTFAAFVNEQHPFTDKLLREALDIGVVGQFDGYQGKSPEAVIKQVYAIWDLLVARDVRYSSITGTAGESEQILSQNVRLLEDTINNQQANCVDGSVLLVSLLRKIEIESFLILVPGHCYVGFYLDSERTTVLAIETTLLGTSADEPDTISEILLSSVEEDLRDDYSWASFVTALEVGTANWLESQEKFADAAELSYRLIDIGAARKIGILPLPFQGQSEFVAFDHSEYSRYSDASANEGDDEEMADEDDDAEDETGDDEWTEEEDSEEATEE